MQSKHNLRDELLWAQADFEAAAEAELDGIREAFSLAAVSAPRSRIEEAMVRSDAGRMRKVAVLRRVQFLREAH
jgi:hypothetical protein